MWKDALYRKERTCAQMGESRAAGDEISKLWHEVRRVAAHALARARKVKEEGEPAVRAALERLERVEREIHELGGPEARLHLAHDP
jgi:hypothetical protein